MSKFTHESFLEYAAEQAKALKTDAPAQMVKRRDSLLKAVAVAKLATGVDFPIECFVAPGDKTTPNTDEVVDLQSSAQQAAKFNSAVAQNFDVLLQEASNMAKSAAPIEKRDLGLDEDGFPEDLNDPQYLKGLSKKPDWGFDS